MEKFLQTIVLDSLLFRLEIELEIEKKLKQNILKSRDLTVFRKSFHLTKDDITSACKAIIKCKVTVVQIWKM